jgi:rhomboid protease GluP
MFIVVLIPVFLMGFIALSLAYRATTPEQRQKLFETGRPLLRAAVETAVETRRGFKPFNDVLRARTRFVLLTPGLILLNAGILGLMMYRGAALTDPQTLINWGAVFGPRTTNGEWWRLITALFLHVGVLQLLVTVVVLVGVGSAIERLVGPGAVAVVYLAAGVIANLAKMSASQVSVITGSSGAVWGLYGILLVWFFWGLFTASSLKLPVDKLKWVASGAVLFVIYTAATAGIDRSVALALATGLVSGLVLLIRSADQKPSSRRIGMVASAAAIVFVAYAIPLNGIVDVRPEIEQVVALESRATDTYKAALDQFQKRRISLSALVQTIDSAIVPPLEAADARLKSYAKVPPEQVGLLRDAETYVELRRESWRLRTAALRQINEPTPAKTTRRNVETRHRMNISAFGKAEECERSSLEALKRVKVATSSDAPHGKPGTPP